MRAASQDPDHQTMLAWASLVHAGLFLTHGLDDELKRKCGFSLAEQDLLARVDRASGGLRMSDLADRLFFSRAGMTKMVDRLETADLVSRERSPEDRRAISIDLTPRGKRELSKSRRVLKAWVKANFAERLSVEDLGKLGGCLERLLRAHDRWEPQLDHLGVPRRGE